MGGFIEAYNAWFTEDCFSGPENGGSVGTLAGGKQDLFIGTHGFSASRSNSIYGSSSAVTPLSLSTKLILKY